MDSSLDWKFEAIGTQWHLEVLQNLDEAEKKNLINEIDKTIEIFDKNYSRFRDDSLVTQMSHVAGTYALPQDGEKLLGLYQKLYQLSDGLFTPLIGQVLVDAGYDTDYSLQEKTLHPADKWGDVLDYSYPKLTLKKPAILDFGAAGKGYLVDIVGQVLEKHGLHSFCIDAGGDILYRTKENEPRRIGLEDPQDVSKVIGVASITNESICGSAGNRRAWGNFHHVIHPYELVSPRHILACWVIAKEAILADAITTCLFFVPAEKIAPFYHFEYLILYPSYSVEQSEHFPAELFTPSAP